MKTSELLSPGVKDDYKYGWSTEEILRLTLPPGINEHYGMNTEIMPKILSSGETPISVAGLMKARLEHGEEFPDIWNNYMYTSDLAVYPKRNKGEVYFLLTVDNKNQVTENGRKALELMRKDNLADNYGAIVDDLSSLGKPGSNGLIKVFRDAITTETYLTPGQALNEKTWRILARDPELVPPEFAEDPSLLFEYVKAVKSKTGRYTNMNIHLGDSLKKQNTLKAWSLFRSDLDFWSSVDARYIFDYDQGRFASITPDALVAKNSQDTPEAVRAYNESDVEKYSQALGKLRETFSADSELVKDISSLEGKL